MKEGVRFVWTPLPNDWGSTTTFIAGRTRYWTPTERVTAPMTGMAACFTDCGADLRRTTYRVIQERATLLSRVVTVSVSFRLSSV